MMQTTGFGLSTAAGAAVGSAIVKSSLGIAMLATPVGWVFAIGTALALGYGAAKFGDGLGQWVAGLAYDTSAHFSRF
ncbi:hypothetical protein [Thalassomonas actiniarum]|uniref:Uncharacterized protein n=1 Tax=Thalassomonas actiniarum TaxID=485447 RepID=A0AAE9YT51_9GAMM|nr:hypothetical protein [Thalassomonas actiniarum]WDE00745.1 hypothetical protein SG35_008990 [Thalassomonas actiniarum]